MVERILDHVGWTADIDLARRNLLEPAAGDGAFVIAAAERLVRSLERFGKRLDEPTLLPRIRAFELHEGEAKKGRSQLIALLTGAGLSPQTASVVAGKWLRTGDFLLTELKGGCTHVVGNPPYARWSKIPKTLRAAYEAALPSGIAKGDLFLPFLDRGIEALAVGGRLGFLCSDRWQYMAFAEKFRTERLPDVRILSNEKVDADTVYQRGVDIYPSILILERRAFSDKQMAVVRSGRTLKEAGFEVRVGPALGCTEAYVVDADDAEVEDELLALWLNASDVGEGEIRHTDKRIICLYDEAGKLRDPTDFPLAHAHLLRFKARLEARAVVRHNRAPWYRPIDRVFAAAWAAPKLLVPEMAKTPRVAFDESGAVPSHGVYAIMATRPGADLMALHQQLRNGGLARALDGNAPLVKGGYVRCYKRFLEAIRL